MRLFFSLCLLLLSLGSQAQKPSTQALEHAEYLCEQADGLQIGFLLLPKGKGYFRSGQELDKISWKLKGDMLELQPGKSGALQKTLFLELQKLNATELQVLPQDQSAYSLLSMSLDAFEGQSLSFQRTALLDKKVKKKELLGAWLKDGQPELLFFQDSLLVAQGASSKYFAWNFLADARLIEIVLPEGDKRLIYISRLADGRYALDNKSGNTAEQGLKKENPKQKKKLLLGYWEGVSQLGPLLHLEFLANGRSLARMSNSGETEEGQYRLSACGQYLLLSGKGTAIEFYPIVQLNKNTLDLQEIVLQRAKKGGKAN